MLLSKIAHSQDFKDILVGEWSEFISLEDCPNYLSFYSNGRYSVCNDCVPGKFLNEVGDWQYDSITKNLSLHNRDVIADSSLFNGRFGGTTIIMFEVRSQANDTFTLFCKSNSRALQEKYERLNVKTKLEESINGNSNLHKVIELPPIVTNIYINYEIIPSAHQLIIQNQNGKELYKTELSKSNIPINNHIPLYGLTQIVNVRKLVFIINSVSDKNWKIELLVK